MQEADGGLPPPRRNEWLQQALPRPENASAAAGKPVNAQGNTSVFTVP